MDELPMITSMDIQMKENIVFINLLNHIIVEDKLQDRNSPRINGMNLTSEEYREFLS